MPRDETIEQILKLLPPRGADEMAARANLGTFDAVALNSMRDELAEVAKSLGTPAVAPRLLPERRDAARDRMSEAFRRLGAATARFREANNLPQGNAEPSDRMVATSLQEVAEAVTAVDAAPAAPWEWEVLAGAGVAVDLPLPDHSSELEELRNLLRRKIYVRLASAIGPESEKVVAVLSSRLHMRAFDQFLQMQVESMERVLLSILKPYPIPDLMEIPDCSASSTSPEMAFIATPVVEEPEAIRGLARMAAHMRSFEPQNVIMLRGGGEIAGQLCKEAASTNANFVVGDATKPDLGLALSAGVNSDRILVIDDISRTGDTFARTFDRCRTLFPYADIRGMALVGSAESMERLGDSIYLPNVSSRTDVKLPWDTRGKYRNTETSHLLGDGMPASPFTIPHQMLDNLIQRY